MTPLYTHREGKVVLTGDNAVKPETAHRIAMRHMEAATAHLKAQRWNDAHRAMDCACEAMNAVRQANAFNRAITDQQIAALAVKGV